MSCCGDRSSRQARAAVELTGDSGDVVVVEVVEVGAFGEGLAQEPVGVLVRAALPRGVRVSEVDPHTGDRLDPFVVEHLVALVPRQRSPQRRRQRGERGDELVADQSSVMAAAQWHEDRMSRLAFDERGDR